ncbi:unnamed protein product [Closterium sp. Naga37s-1]|nr:unnamed protein product [Closterium sp. Naga37s-1]
MWWMRDLQLEEANEILQKVRPCGPKLFAIRAAACDLLTGNPLEQVEINWRNRGVNETVEVAGLDVGWHHEPIYSVTSFSISQRHASFFSRPPALNNTILPSNPPPHYGPLSSSSQRLPLTREPASNTWTLTRELPVVGSSLDPAARDLRKRIMQEGAPLTLEDRAAVVAKIVEIAGTL